MKDTQDIFRICRTECFAVILACLVESWDIEMDWKRLLLKDELVASELPSENKTIRYWLAVYPVNLQDNDNGLTLTRLKNQFDDFDIDSRAKRAFIIRTFELERSKGYSDNLCEDDINRVINHIVYSVEDVQAFLETSNIVHDLDRPSQNDYPL